MVGVSGIRVSGLVEALHARRGPQHCVEGCSALGQPRGKSKSAFPSVGRCASSRNRSSSLPSCVGRCKSVGCQRHRHRSHDGLPPASLAVEHHHAAGGLMISASPQSHRVERTQVHPVPTGVFLRENSIRIENAVPSSEKGISAARHGTSLASKSRSTTVPVHRHIDRVLAIPYLGRRGHSPAQSTWASTFVRGAAP